MAFPYYLLDSSFSLLGTTLINIIDAAKLRRKKMMIAKKKLMTPKQWLPLGGHRRSLSSSSSNGRFSLMKTYHLTGQGENSFTRMVSPHLPQSPMECDVPRKMGGSDKAPEPIELFLSALCGCKLVTMQFVARNMKPRIAISRIDFDIMAERDARGALTLPIGKDTVLPSSHLKRIWGNATVHTSAAVSQDRIDIIEAEVKRRCPIASMVVMSGCELDIKFKFVPNSEEN